MRFLEPKRISGRDAGIAELIEYFDADERVGRWDLLTDKELEIIEGEATRCKEHFSYAARNYFSMVNKRREEKIFEFWESQMLILDRLQQLQDRRRPGKILVVKARQLGCSLLLEMLVAWKSMFFQNTNSAVVSYDPDHSAYLFSLMQYVYDRMPWWLRPMCSSREFKNGLVFENPNYEDRRRNPGLNSRITVQSANKLTGVGQGIKINVFHGSEIGDWANAAEVIDGDLVNALVEDWDTIAALESTAKGSGNYFHRLWLRNVELGESAEWHPIFMPWFFESTRVLAPPGGWRPKPEELQMQQQVEMEWLRCSNPTCKQYHERLFRDRDRSGSVCPTCTNGFLVAYKLTPEQMFWREVKRLNSDRDEVSAKLLKQEMATTATDAFQSSGYTLFPEVCQSFVQQTVREPRLKGHFDGKDQFHAIHPVTLQCVLNGCGADHYADARDVWVWELPDPNSEYVMGADVAEGLGGPDSDFSVAVVLRLGKNGAPDRQVAKFRSNTTSPIEFAYMMKSLGKWYNTAMIAVELNKYDIAAGTLRFNLQYPNLYRWKALDATNILTNKFGWVTNQVTKPRLYQTFIRYLKANMVIIRSKNCSEEMKTFQKEDMQSRGAEAALGAFDDELMATMIALYCGHEAEYDDNLGYQPFSKRVTLDNAPWIMSCGACGEKWGQEAPNERVNCPKCNSIRIYGQKNSDFVKDEMKETITDELFDPPESSFAKEYELL